MGRAGIAAGAAARMTPARLALLSTGPIAVALGSWIYLAIMIDDMSTVPGMSAMMMHPQVFTPMQFMGLFVMWAVMMAAMMLPTAAPMILAYARMQAADRRKGAGWLPVFAFSGGYVISWVAFSLGAAALQAGLINLALMSPMMMKTSGPLAGGVLVVAGLYQFSAVKHACLRQCRTPIGFLMTQWREGGWGALRMGWRHGLFCVGCCWALMGLLFVAGVMNAAWIIVITVYVLGEKIIPDSEWLSKFVGVILAGFGLWFIL